MLRVAFILLLLVSCSTATTKKDPTPPTKGLNELYQQAQSHAKKNELRSAVAKFNRVTSESPSSTLAMESHIALGDIFFSQGKWSEALQSYSRVSQGSVRTPLEGVAGIKAGQCLLNQDKLQEALTQIDSALRIPGIEKSVSMQGLKLRLTVLKRMNAPLEELKTLLHLHAGAESDSLRQEYRVQAIAEVESGLTAEQLEIVARDSNYGFAQPPALFRAGVINFERAQYSAAKNYLESARQLAPNSELSERSSELIEQISARERVNPRRIGVILPMSGRSQRVGLRTLRGLQMGLGIFGKNKSGLELAVIDSAGNPATARRAVERLVVEDNVIAVVSGISSKEASAIATKAQEFGLPSFVLSQRSGLTDIGDFVFRNALTSEMQVQQLVHEAIKIRGLSKFAILSPKDSYGDEFARLFWAEVEKQGGEIRAARTYQPGQTDFSQEVKQLVGTANPEARKWEYRLRLEEWKKSNPVAKRKGQPTDLLPPIVDFEAIFIPDQIKALQQIAPSLAYAEVKNVLMLGTNLWNTSSALERVGRYMESTLFVDSFLFSDPLFSGSNFFKESQEVFGEAPEDFELFAYDTGLVIRRILDGGASTRSEFQTMASRLPAINGAFGQLTMTPTREILRPIVTLTVRENQIVKADAEGLKR